MEEHEYMKTGIVGAQRANCNVSWTCIQTDGRTK